MVSMESQLVELNRVFVNLSTELKLLGSNNIRPESRLDISGVSCRAVQDDYEIASTDFYIGVSGVGHITLYLPPDPPIGKQYIIKVEGEIGEDSAATVLCKEVRSCIDGKVCVVLRHRYSALHVLYHNDGWNIISSYGID